LLDTGTRSFRRRFDEVGVFFLRRFDKIWINFGVLPEEC
jgi:hypothetical protein